MSKVIEVQLDWKYTPPDYLEEPVYISEDGFEFSISDGLAVAKKLKEKIRGWIKYV